MRILVPGAGIEPARRLKRGILSPLCLPIPPPGQYYIGRIAHATHAPLLQLEAEPGIEPGYTALQAAA
jgi:hypothetical protein